jgi:hypothetical protein
MKLRLQRKIEQAELVRRSRESLDQQVAMPCEMHPAWRVSLPPTKLAPPAHLCPYCRKEGERHRLTREEERVVAHPLAADRLTPKQEDLAQLFWEKNPEKLEIEGAPAEEALLEQIDALRDEEQGADDQHWTPPVHRHFENAYGHPVSASGQLLPVRS